MSVSRYNPHTEGRSPCSVYSRAASQEACAVRQPSGRSGRANVRDQYAELTRLAMLGDREATAELLSKLTPALRKTVRRFGGASGVDTEDCVQESLLRITQALPSFRGECSVLHFSLSIAIRCAHSLRRRQLDRLRSLQTAQQLEYPLLGAPESLMDAVASRRRQRALGSLLGRLPEAQAKSLRLRVLLGYSLAEVAHRTGVPVNTVRTRLRLGRLALRRYITQDRRLRELLGERPE